MTTWEAQHYDGVDVGLLVGLLREARRGLVAGFPTRADGDSLVVRISDALEEVGG